MIDADGLRELEDRVDSSLATGSPDGLRVLGYGEITLVLGWPAGEPRFACKRLPVFANDASAVAYGKLVHRYVQAISARGVDVLDTEYVRIPRPGGKVAAYVVQPVVADDLLATRILSGATPDPKDPVITAVLDRVAAVVDDRLGFDAQLSNWALVEDRLRYFDVTTPIMRSDEGRNEIDLDLFMAAFPWAVRGALRRFVAPGVLARYHDRRTVMLDLAANLRKERLQGWIPAVVAAANRHLDRAITEEEVRKDYASDARQWDLLLRLRRADRWWQRRVRRRPYPFLLPGPIER